MGLYWNPTGVLGVVAMVVTLALAWMVYLSAPKRATNRILALMLFFQGIAVGTGAGLLYLSTDPKEAYAWQSVSVTAALVLPSIYLAFLGQLETPVVSFLRTNAARVVLFLFALAVEVYWFLRPEEFICEVYAPTEGYAMWDFDYGRLYQYTGYLRFGILIFALAVAVLSIFHARKGFQRAQMKAYSAAFGTRDVFEIFIILSYSPIALFPEQLTGSLPWIYASVVGFPIMIFGSDWIRSLYMSQASLLNCAT